MGPKAKLPEIVWWSFFDRNFQNLKIQLKKHFFTHKECPDFDGPKSNIAQKCPKIIFSFDQKIPNSKMKLKNDPLN